MLERKTVRKRFDSKLMKFLLDVDYRFNAIRAVHLLSSKESWRRCRRTKREIPSARKWPSHLFEHVHSMGEAQMQFEVVHRQFHSWKSDAKNARSALAIGGNYGDNEDGNLLVGHWLVCCAQVHLLSVFLQRSKVLQTSNNCLFSYLPSMLNAHWVIFSSYPLISMTFGLIMLIQCQVLNGPYWSLHKPCSRLLFMD